jgi:hypothetical protein
VAGVVIRRLDVGVDGVASGGVIVDRHLGVCTAVVVVLDLVARGKRVEYREGQ